MVANVARCDRWLADTYAELGDGNLAYEHARKSLNVAELMQERMPIMFSQYVIGKALRVRGELLDDASDYLERSYNRAIAVESDEMDWEFILKIQRERITLLRMLDRNPEADEFEAQIQTITEVIE